MHTIRRGLSLVLVLVLVISLCPATFAAIEASATPMYIGSADIDYGVDLILQELPLQGKTDAEKIALCYDWIITHCSRKDWDGTVYYDSSDYAQEIAAYRTQIEQLKSSGKIVLRPDLLTEENAGGGDYDSNWNIVWYLEEMLYTRTGNCAHYSALLTLMLSHLGIDCRMINGDFVNMDGSQVVHTWNLVRMNGVNYWLDVRIDHATYVREGMKRVPHDYFMVTSTEAWEKEHIWDHTYSDWLCGTLTNTLSTSTTKPTWSVCSEWAEPYLYKAQAQGLIPSSLDDADMTKTISRQEFAAVAVLVYQRLGGTWPAVLQPTPFSDVDDPAVTMAYVLGIVYGTGNGKYSPDDSLTREQASTMMGRIFGLLFVEDPADFVPYDEDLFADDAQISEYARSYVYYMAALDILNGVGNNRFDPQSAMTREQALKIAACMMFE